jgi:LytS/YehU family sensor histidine kinase
MADILKVPNAFLQKTILLMQLFIIPAFIYAYVKVQLKQKNIGFKLLRNKEAELNQLRSQVNPHFLFNSLNTLYAFALKENNPKTAEYIAKLANLMRYLVDDMEKEKIPVQREISYIGDYINLQSIRSSVEHKIDINIAIDEDRNILIAPMLMIPFVENAFKHGINPSGVSELKVTFQVKDERFQFVIENSVDKNFVAFNKEKGFGIGIPNVRQRLEYIYPGRHTLSIAETGDRFIVILTIELSRMTEEEERG